MAFEHRQTERRKAETELQRFAKQLVELYAASKIASGQIALWGGPQIEDFNGDSPENAAARLNETVVALEGYAKLVAVMQEQVGDYGVTVEQALMRIAAA